MAKRHKANEEFLPIAKKKRDDILASHPNQEIIKIYKRQVRLYQ